MMDMTTGIEWEIADFRPMWRQETFRSNNQVQVRDLGPMLWHTSYQSGPMPKDEAEAFEAKMMALRGSLGTFTGHPAQRPQPARYRSGGLGSATIHSVRSDRGALRITGLPEGLDLTEGDHVSIETDAGGFEFVRLTKGGPVSSTGLSAWIECSPALRVSVKVGQTAKLKNPPMELRLDAGGVTLTRVSGLLYVVGFDATQVIR
ncbi:hypothetical protein [uncultured Jannaschia sp.]|uniref:hypothetical protein n=1 Tax=uncultured Jannaschia sp. TaxID=293347 RepID=UPI002616B15F|nr:hypothetical protein [uncultured Jannaschia sp.]